MNEQLYNSSGSHVPHVEDLAAFLTKTIPIISSSMKLLFDRFSKTPTLIKNADVVPIWQKNFSTIPYTGSNASSSTNESIIDSWERLVNTTLSYLAMNVITNNVTYEDFKKIHRLDTLFKVMSLIKTDYDKEESKDICYYTFKN